MRVKVKVNVRPKTQTAEDNWIRFLVEKLGKKDSLEESDFPELFQKATKHNQELMKFVQDSRKSKNKDGERRKGFLENSKNFSVRNSGSHNHLLKNLN